MIDLFTGLILGFAGSLHCAAMCGPIALALPPGTGSRLQFFGGRSLYNAGRITTYIGLGGILGSIGGLFALAGLQQALSIAVGVVMIMGVLLPTLVQRLPAKRSPLVTLHTWLHRTFRQLLDRRSLSALFGFGLLNGLLPCGLLYAALGAAAALGSPFRGMIFLAAFGAGTLPIMLGISLAGTSIRLEVRKKISAILPAFTFALAVLLILRGLNLGIPYVSPHIDPAGAATESRCH